MSQILERQDKFVHNECDQFKGVPILVRRIYHIPAGDHTSLGYGYLAPPPYIIGMYQNIMMQYLTMTSLTIIDVSSVDRKEWVGDGGSRCT